MNQARVHIGVDVGKECLDICYPDGSKEHIGNTKRSRAKLIRKARAKSAIVSFEATGPYEENLADECLAAGVPAVRLDAWKARKYAESQGMLEKTDAIDCEMIRDFAASLKPEQLRFVRPMSDGYRRLKRATSVRRNLIKAKTLVVNQLENILDKDVRASVSRVIDALERQIEKMDALCTEAIRSDEKMNAFADAAETNDWAVEAMRWACAREIIGGVDGQLQPKAAASRAQAVKMLVFFMDHCTDWQLRQ